MQDMKKLNEVPKQKERHIVTWTQQFYLIEESEMQEDDILREQISIHGTENWAIIAAKFMDKTTRQCRRRWYTYLNSDFKKGGWSPEEDMILCEAQKIFGNRWTEIAKVVSGRTDNAVKNRFSTLCKKKAKREALTKENNTSHINPNNKRVVIFQNGLITDGTSEPIAPLKKMRTHMSDLTESCSPKGRSLKECGTTENQQLRPPFAVLVQNLHNVCNLPAQQHVGNNTKAAFNNVGRNKDQGTFLRKDDPKINALMQQAELLTSLALKVSAENTNQSLENAWKELQGFLNQTKESDMLTYKISEMDFLFEDFKDLVEDLKSCNMGSPASCRQPDPYEESPGSSEYSIESTLQSHTAGDKTEQTQAEVSSPPRDIGVRLQSIHLGVQNGSDDCKDGVCNSASATQAAGIFPFCDKPPVCDKPKDDDGIVPALLNTEFSSPLQVTPLFRSMAAGIPSPKFSESERNFLLKTLGLASPSPNPSANPSQPPPCRRALLHSL
ncbi:hypothetical protein HHK36_007213 [Tetracentron sinense]|uniref:Uncharacterized protein n=1 Tax=Tetracentron sinense TaxID=13715 RepID=A0A834ZKI5_TETSI|nr:hypothetical protein HHK36_007213 [Tetracentron sinense]